MPRLSPPRPAGRPPVDPAPPGRHRRASRGRLPGVMIVITLVVATVPVGVSIGQALGAPGQAGTSVRLVEWLRDHGGGGLVNVVENTWYARNQPGSGPPDPASIPAASAAGAAGPTPS